MNKSIVVLDTYYAQVLNHLHLDKRIIGATSYEEEISRVAKFGFGTGASYTNEFLAHGWDAQLIIPNSLGLQDLWSRDNMQNPPIGSGWKYLQLAARTPLAGELLHLAPHAHKILLNQIKRIRPEILYVQDINFIPPSLATELKQFCKLLVGEIASPLPPMKFIVPYSRIMSAHPGIVKELRGDGIPSTYLPLGFDQRFASNRPMSERDIEVAFVGNFTRLQPNTGPLLRLISSRIPSLAIFGSASKSVLEQYGLSEFHHNPVWGFEMFNVLSQSKIVINRHGQIAGDYAVNMRMFEATGCGAALVTESKSNLNDLFDVNTEVLAYEDIEDAANICVELLANTNQLSDIANSGHLRTITEHTYHNRISKLSEVLLSDLEKI